MAEFMYASNTFVPYNYPAEEADIVFLGVPFSSTSISETSQYGPVIVRECLRLIEGQEEKSGRDFTRKKICDIGNIEIVPGSYELTAERVKETIEQVREVSKNSLIITIGGDHLSTLPVVESLRPGTIIQLDAHRDLKDEYLGNRFSHSTWARRAAESTGCEIVQIGTRESSAEELEAEKKLGIKKGTQFLKEAKDPLYISIDMDVFDPCYVETGFPVSGGMTPDEVLEIIGMLKGRKIIGMDINEISSRTMPSKTGFLAAEIIRKVLSIL